MYYYTMTLPPGPSSLIEVKRSPRDEPYRAAKRAKSESDPRTLCVKAQQAGDGNDKAMDTLVDTMLSRYDAEHLRDRLYARWRLPGRGSLLARSSISTKETTEKRAALRQAAGTMEHGCQGALTIDQCPRQGHR
jgi:hypothetical protein